MKLKKLFSIFVAMILMIGSLTLFGSVTKLAAFTDEPEDGEVVIEANQEGVEEPESSETITHEQEDPVEAEAASEIQEEATQPATVSSGIIAPRSANTSSLKAQIEAATTDVTIQLDAGVYEFDMDGASAEIKNTLPIKVTLVGAVDGEGLPTTQFTMAPSVTGTPRFIRVDAGTLDISNVQVIGTKDVNGGVSARNVIAKNSIFLNNYTSDGVSGGGAIRANGGTLTIEDSIFNGNSVAPTSDGGAVSAEYSGNVYINNSSFDNNTRIGNNNQYGGALSIKQPSAANTTIVITNSSFTNNKVDATGSWTRGGAIHIYSSPQVSSVLIDNTLFKGNAATRSLTNNGGAIAFMTMTTKSTISNSTFMDNSAAKYGGGVYYENSTGDNQIINSTFVGNRATLGGTSVGAYSSRVTLDSSTFISNSFATQGSGSLITVKDSIVAGTAAYTSATISYTGTNLARKTSGEAAVNAADVFTAYTSATLEKVSDYNYVAPIKENGPAWGQVSTARSLSTAQNGLVRKTPLSDLGAYETAQKFVVEFNSNGGGDIDSQSIANGGLVSEPTVPIKGDYTFGGWFTDDGTFANEWNFATSTVTKNETLYAKWTAPVAYHITYDGNGATRGTVNLDAIDYTRNSSTILKDQHDLEKDHYTFVGWSIDPTGSGTILSPGDEYTVLGDTTFFAIWRADNYSVTYNGNNATSGDVPLDDGEYEYSNNAIIKGNDNLVRTGYTFAGWSTSADGKGTRYNAGDQYTVNESVTFYAVWVKDGVEEVIVPSKTVTPPAASVDSKSISTSDVTNMTLLIALIAISGVGLVALRKSLQKQK